MSLFKRKKSALLPIGLPVPSFSEAWAQGKFDDCDYYALTAPIDEWSAAYPMHCLSEAAEDICDDGWGIVTWKLIVYVYSSESMAVERAKFLGGNVKPMKVKCIACFAKAFSNLYKYVDMVLDESWHIEAYLCRDLDMGMPGVSHLRLSAPDGLYQLQGCEGNNSLEWIQYPSYGEPNHPPEWCRPVAFPAGMVMCDHRPQGGPMDMEIISDPENLEFYFVDGVELARDVSGTRDVIFTRPTGPVAFSELMGEPVRLTSGEGVWIPVAIGIEGILRIPEWAETYKPYVDKILNSETKATKVCRGCQWHINKAITLVEQAFLRDDAEIDGNMRAEAIQGAIKQLEKAVEATPWDWYAKTMLRDLKAVSVDEVPALIHADRCGWLAGRGEMDQLEEEYEAAMAAKPNYHLAMYSRAMAQQFIDNFDACAEGLEELLRHHPHHAQALFDLGVIACRDGDEKREMELYAKAIKADPTFTPPYYNTGKTHEDNGNIQLAREFYEKTLELNPHYIEAAEQLAGIMEAEGDYKGMVRLLLGNIQSDPCRVTTYENLFQTAQKLDDNQLVDMTFQALQKNLPRIAVQMQEGSDEQEW